MAIRCPASPRKTRRPSPLYTGWGLRSKSTMATPMGGEIAYCKQGHVFIVELRALQKKSHCWERLGTATKLPASSV